MASQILHEILSASKSALGRRGMEMGAVRTQPYGAGIGGDLEDLLIHDLEFVYVALPKLFNSLPTLARVLAEKERSRGVYRENPFADRGGDRRRKFAR